MSEVDDAQLLTIGAQENLQRQDLDPIEEAQIVAWYERLFFDKNQAEIGAMLGKSSDWVSVRSRIHKLPDLLVARLRQRPGAIGQMLELGTLYAQQPTLAVRLADRVVNENLTVTAIRSLVRDAKQSEPKEGPSREESHNRRANATVVQDVTSSFDHSQRIMPLAGETQEELSVTAYSVDATADGKLLIEIVDGLTFLASRADKLDLDILNEEVLSQLETAVNELRHFYRRRMSQAHERAD